eukprot:c24871_g2_i1 orf=90-2618(+)
MLCEPLAMASVFRSLTVSQATNSSSISISISGYNQYGARLSCTSPLYQKASHLKVRDMSSFSHSNSLVLITKAQLPSSSTTTAEELHEVLDSSSENTQETPDVTPLSSLSNAAKTSTLPKRYAHLSELFTQLSAGVDVPSAMEPWLQKLTLYDWTQLVIECGRKDWNISMQIVAFYREKEAVLDQSVLLRKQDGEEASPSSAGTSLESTKDLDTQGEEGEGLETPQKPTVQEDKERMASATESLDSPAGSAQEVMQQSSGNVSPVLKLYTALAKVLARKRRHEELDHVQVQVKEADIEPDIHFYNVLLDSYVERRLFPKAFEFLQEMKSAGFKPNRYVYEKLAHIYMSIENPDSGVLMELADDLKEGSMPVSIAVYKRILRDCWEARDLDGAEETFEAMLVAGHTPDLKVLLKLMQLNGRKGNHERVVELVELMVKWGIKPNASVYDYLVHAYCKSGLLEKAKETLLKFESVLGYKPTTIALNMLIDGYGKQGLYEAALETFEGIRKYGYRPSEVSYSSIISAMAQVGKFHRAAQLYERMLKERIQPNMHTYSTLIRSFTKCNQTREGHKIYTAMRKTSVQLTEAAYSASLALYVDGTWYHHAAALLKEIEEKGIVLDAAAHSALIRSFSILHNNTTPLARAVQESELEICKLLTRLFHTTSESQKLEAELIEAVRSLLEEWKETVSLDAKALVYNAFIDYFWRKGYKEMAKVILDMGREVYAGYSQPRLIETEWVLDVRGLGVGGAKVAVSDWLFGAKEALEDKEGDDWKMVVITGDGFSLSLPQDNSAVKRAISSMLTELSSPFVESPESSERMEANLADTLKWVSQDEVKETLSLSDSC